ncbi:MAG: hypothetical protein NPIRA06_25350 [Nitrospirales bacterium]|nr:MAG: hypothetical protein NPIRA06_25350 [Nitrospirales bacterium]
MQAMPIKVDSIAVALRGSTPGDPMYKADYKHFGTRAAQPMKMALLSGLWIERCCVRGWKAFQSK